MPHFRLIARLDIKAPNLIKSIQFEGVRVVGDPAEFAGRYYRQGIDEILFVDAVASLYGRNSLLDLVTRTAETLFVPLTVGGGLRSVADVRAALRAGADKVALNTAALARPELVAEIASTFGSQCMVLSVQAKRRRDGGWEAYTDGGREHSGRDVLDWVRQAEELGAGEILLTSVDREGTRRGFDTELVAAVRAAVSVPVVASGGMGSVAHLAEAARAGADAAAMAHVLHYGELDVAAVREGALAAGLDVRRP